MNIKIKVAYCTQCQGYSSATPVEKKHISHPDIIDHFFYHGEPWFTLDHDTFETVKNLENTEERVITLQEHMENDNLYCRCQKDTVHLQQAYSTEEYTGADSVSWYDHQRTDADYYFTDLYHTYNTFHGIAPIRNNMRHPGQMSRNLRKVK
ncbi:hypothetical protein [uncultured Chryseobacterium sp.]|uniref:hypothetical protein n=1 Tax=uncultured Chryseobacterium sp. TaxID=259322 RepID=UPI0025F9C3A6|nr:hypothetical protein [uncultured Chryseobacterium sp.]